jgi:hypothetical protein
MSKPPSQDRMSKGMRWTSYVLSALPVLFMGMSAVMKLVQPPMVVEGFAKNHISSTGIMIIGVVELSCGGSWGGFDDGVPGRRNHGACDSPPNCFGGAANSRNVRLGRPLPARLEDSRPVAAEQERWLSESLRAVHAYPLRANRIGPVRGCGAITRRWCSPTNSLDRSQATMLPLLGRR